MMVYQLHANLPGRGRVAVFTAPDLEEGLNRLDGGPDDFNGNASFSMGAAFLAPFVNRIRGRFMAQTREIETTIAGRIVTLPANGGGKAPGAEQYAIHGLILDRAAQVGERFKVPGGEAVQATLDAGDFGGHWLSTARLEFEIRLTGSSFAAVVRAINTGSEPMPIGLGWHPYFNIPSGEREQARIRLPAKSRLAVNDYDEVLPTGEIVPVAGTKYDFTQDGGRALAGLYLDDCFADLVKDSGGRTVCDVIDPSSGYHLRMVSDSPEISALQTFAPPERPMVVIEPQFSWADPYGDSWAPGVDTGMVLLKPGESVDYRVRLELPRP
ncbi:MAG: aldose 1-epimerase [Allosphingosinicella sp.]